MPCGGGVVRGVIQGTGGKGRGRERLVKGSVRSRVGRREVREGEETNKKNGRESKEG